MTDTVLRVIGTPATLTPELRARAAADLPFGIQFEVLDGLDCQRRGVMAPESFDVYDQWFHSLDLLWTAASIRPIDTTRLARWDEVTIAGTRPGANGRQPGSWPGSLLYAQSDRSLAATPQPGAAPQISMLPTTYNVDSFVWTPDMSALRRAEEAESWAWLLDGRWHGRAALAADPAASVVELALAARAAGLVDIADPGDLTIEEIDALFAVLMPLRRSGHFTRFWATSDDAVRLMTPQGSGGGPVISALWSPAYYAMRAMGRDLHYAVPGEGYRGWHSGLCLSAALSGERLEMAYAWLNWWLDGVPGAIMARQGYYMSVVQPLRDTLTPAEWAFWYAGEPACEDLAGSDGQIVVRRGERREGGSYQDRVARIAVWSTIMPEHNYLIRRWREFLGD
ncbi:PotD/PotF family extracellular solute-binding protein [Paracoccus sp. IB05]|uniref:ABC transporter substrate-binding protein n=1 Tax=Paracoccus sp. IB05 TaxID=2779367 RepID=UPI0018E79D55|nr:extracellular solute-binding protein [Paracoccus sp. IB05]MBJ2150991.1 hypothetical protein [Paracoccus sp. IB05]